MRLKYSAYILLAASFEIAGCTDNQEEWVDDDAPLSIAVTASWQNGREENETRALPAFITADVLKTPPPEWVYIALPSSLGNTNFYVANASSTADIATYIHYEDFYSKDGTKLDKSPITRNLAQTGDITAYYKLENGAAVDPKTFTPFSTLPDISNCDFISSDPTRYPVEEGHRDHLLFTMYHRTALLRLKFAVNPNYLKVRDIVLRKITINNQNVDFIDYSILDGSDGNKLSSTPSFIAFAYINPSETTTFGFNTLWTFECTYDIYDKDEISATHLTRKGVTARNNVNMTSLLSSENLEAGKYYDLTITINPDYLYVLSEHDNKHITIN